jgi:hypothetical protein
MEGEEKEGCRMVVLWSDPASSVRVVRLVEPEEIETLVCLFEEVAEQERWQPNGALRLWLERSVYFAVEVQGQIVGGLQLVLPDASRTLPCQSVWPEVPIRPISGCAHVAILALAKDIRGQNLLFWRLAVEMWRYCVAERISMLYIEVTPRVLPLYRRLGWPLVIRGELRLHWGEDCSLCSLGIAEVAETILRRSEGSPFYRQIVAQAFRVTLMVRETTGPAALYAA